MPDFLDTFLNTPQEDPLDAFLAAPEEDDLDRFLDVPEPTLPSPLPGLSFLDASAPEIAIEPDQPTDALDSFLDKPEQSPVAGSKTRPVPELRAAPPPTSVDKLFKFFSPKPTKGVNPVDIARSQIKLEARKAKLPVEKYKDIILPEGAPLRRVERFLSGVGQGAVGTVGSMIGAVDWLADSDIARDLSNKTRMWVKQRAPEDPDFSDALASGIGSSATFFVPGIGVAKGAGALARVAPRLANWAGVAVATVMESMTEAGAVYNNVLHKTKDKEKASRSATITMIANLPLIAVTNKLGVFADRGGTIKRAITSSLMEASQEAGQEVISAKAEDRPLLLKQITTAAGVGALVGGGFGAIAGVIPEDVHPRTLSAREAPAPIESSIRAEELPKSPKPFPDAPAPTSEDKTVLERVIQDETGGVNFVDLEILGLDAVKKINKLVEKLDVYSSVPDKVAEQFIKFNQHYSTISKREGAQISFEMFKQYPKKLQNSLGKLFEHQKTIPLPAEMKPLAEAIQAKQSEWKKRLEKLGINVPIWPDNVIEKNIQTIKSIKTKLKDLQIKKPGVSGQKARQKLIDMRDKLMESNRDLAGLSYLKRFSFDPKRKFLGFRKKPLLKTPKEFFGRHYPTIEAAKAAGKEVLSLPEMVARAERLVLRTEHVHSLIDSIEKNPKFAVSEKMKRAHPELYKDWEMLPRDVLPSARKKMHPGVGVMVGENKFFHPTIARLFKEVTYSPKATTWWKINNTLVSLIFYNPGIMTTNDILQGVMLMGPRFFNPFRLGRAIKTVASYQRDFWPNLGPAMEKVLNLTPEAAAKYKQYQDWGIYNKAISTGEAAEDLAKNMLDAYRATYPKRLVQIAEKVLQHPIKSLRATNDNTTWIMDEVLRTMGMDYAIESGHFDKWGLSNFQKAKETNYAFGWYESIPREMRHAFRKGAFTATFKTAMFKRELRNYKNAFRIAEKEYAEGKGIKVPIPGPQFEQFVWQTFLKGFYRFALPAALLEYYRRQGFKDVKTKIENNYRVVVQNATKDGREIAITPGGPVLETNKLFNRPIGQTIFYQLPPALHTINAIIYGPKFKKWARETGILSEIEPFMKFGIPLKRDIELWLDKDKTTAEKFLQQMGLWYMYYRKPKRTSIEDEQEKHWLRETLNTLGLIPNEIMTKGLPRLRKPQSEEEIKEEYQKGLISRKEALQLRANLETE